MGFEVVYCDDNEKRATYDCSFVNFLEKCKVSSEEIGEVTEGIKELYSQLYSQPNYIKAAYIFSCACALGNLETLIYVGNERRGGDGKPAMVKNGYKDKAYAQEFDFHNLMQKLAKDNSVKNRFKKKKLPALVIEDFYVDHHMPTLLYLLEIVDKYRIVIVRPPEKLYCIKSWAKKIRVSDYLEKKGKVEKFHENSHSAETNASL